MKQLLEDFDIQQKHPIAIGEHNQSCIKLCHDPVMNKKNKHIETKLTSLGKRLTMGSFQFILFLLTKFQTTSSRNPFLYRNSKRSEQFWWEENLRNQLKSVWGVRASIHYFDTKELSRNIALKHLSNHVLNDFDSSGRVNKNLEKCKCFLNKCSFLLVSSKFE